MIMNKPAIKATLATLGVFIGIGLLFLFVITYPSIGLWVFATIMGGFVAVIVGCAVYSVWSEFYSRFKHEERWKK